MNIIWALAISFNIFSLDSQAIENPNYMNILLKQFPNCEYIKENIYITNDQKKSIENKTGKELYSRLGLRFKINCKNKITYAYVDSHIVRTLNETLVVLVNENKIQDIKIAAFNEPPEYKTPEKWNQQYLNKTLKNSLSIGDDIDGITGATLSGHAVNDTVKRVLSIHDEIKIEQK